MTPDAPRNDDVAALERMIRDIRFAMLTTDAPDGTLRSRPMVTVDRDFDGDLWFFTAADAPKVREVREDQQINLAYGDRAKDRYISVSGKAQVVKDAEKIQAFWSPDYQKWLPEGTGPDDVALLRITAEWAEYWEGADNVTLELTGSLQGERPGS